MSQVSTAISQRDLVSIVIPTYRRLDALRLAVESALGQTYRHIEVIVVSDGPDPEIRAAFKGSDPRLQYVELSVNSGPAEARNAGAQASRGEWLAFLDDDDTMLPEKIERQLQLVNRAEPHRMVSCRTIYRHSGRDDVWPRRPIHPGEDLSDYILLRPSLLGRPGVLPVQSLLMHRSLVEQVPFSTQNDHEDWTWLLEVWHLQDARIEFIWEPLVVYNIATETVSRSRRANWRDSFQWALDHRQWISRRAYNSFLSTKVALKAKRAGDWAGLRQIARLVLGNRPGMLDILFLAGMFLLPEAVLHQAWKSSLSTTSRSADNQDLTQGVVK